MTDSLLPKSSTKLERDLERLIARADSLPITIRELWSPWDCPAALLPWLAWAVSVDYWEENWPEKTKRQVIADAFEIHRYKGTPHAVQKALDSLSISTKVTEWWEPAGSGEPGTMTVLAMINDNITGSGDGLIGPKMLSQITRAINDAKRGSIHYDVELGIFFEEGLVFSLGAACGVGVSDDTLEAGAVLPDSTSANLLTGGAMHRVTYSDKTLVIEGLTPDELPGAICASAVCRQAIFSEIRLLGAY